MNDNYPVGNNVKITATYGTIMNKGVWDLFCDMKGINPYCMNEGLASSETQVTLTEAEALKLRLIKVY